MRVCGWCGQIRVPALRGRAIPGGMGRMSGRSGSASLPAPRGRRCRWTSSAHPDLWNGHDTAAAPFTDVRELFDDLVLQIPRQDQHVVRARLLDPLRRKDRDVRAGKKPVVLVRVPVDRVLEEVGADAAVVEQRIALAGRTVAGD